jgi:hypothetical protein
MDSGRRRAPTSTEPPRRRSRRRPSDAAVRITTLYSGLPAHPLFVHLPVILIPVSVVAAIVFMVRPVWFGRYGIVLALVSIVAMSSIFLTMQDGSGLRASCTYAAKQPR